MQEYHLNVKKRIGTEKRIYIGRVFKRIIFRGFYYWKLSLRYFEYSKRNPIRYNVKESNLTLEEESCRSIRRCVLSNLEIKVIEDVHRTRRHCRARESERYSIRCAMVCASTRCAETRLPPSSVLVALE